MPGKRLAALLLLARIQPGWIFSPYPVPGRRSPARSGDRYRSRRESGGMSKEQYPNSLGLRNVSGKTRSSQAPQGNLMRGTFRSIMIVSALAILRTSARAQTPVQMSPARSAPPLNRADLEAWLDGLVPYALQQGDIAGLVVSVVKDGQLLLEKGDLSGF